VTAPATRRRHTRITQQSPRMAAYVPRWRSGWRRRFVNRALRHDSNRERFARLPCRSPQSEQMDLDCIERLCSHRRSIGIRPKEQPVTRLQAKNLKGPRVRIDEPGMAHLPLGIYRQLPKTIEPSSGRRKDLAYPIRSLADVGPAWRRRHPVVPPACQVRNEDVVADMEFRLGEDPPSPWTTFSELERWDKAAARRGGGDAVGRSRTR
jgi:hypothetical protein